MTDPQNDDQKFWQTIDHFISVANAQENAQPGNHQMVGASLLFAAARYNTYLVARANGTQENFLAKKEEAKAYFIEQFTKMLSDNIADYETNFDKYRG